MPIVRLGRNVIAAKLTADLSNFDRGMDRAARTADRVSGQMQRRFRRMAVAVAAVGTAALGMAAAFGKSILDAARTTENLRIRLDALLGSTEEGARAFQLFSQFASTVPFDLEQIVSAGAQLAIVAKGGAEELASLLPLVADISATFGISMEETAQQIVRAFSAGIGAADLFRDRGVSAALGFQAGVSYSAEQTRDRIVSAFREGELNFIGGAQRMAKTWDGIMSNLRDRWFQFRNAIARAGLFDLVKGGLTSLLEAVDQNFDKLVRITRNTIADILDTAASVVRFMERNAAMLELGIVGFLFFGKRGLAAVGLITAAINKLPKLKGLAADLGLIELSPAEEQQRRLEELARRRETLLSRIQRGGAFGAPLGEEELNRLNRELENVDSQIMQTTRGMAFLADEGNRATSVMDGLADQLERVADNLRAGGGVAGGGGARALTDAQRLAQLPGMAEAAAADIRARGEAQLTERFRTLMETAPKQIMELGDIAGETSNNMRRFGNTLESGLGGAVSDVIFGFQSLASATHSLINTLFRVGIEEAVSSLLPFQSGGMVPAPVNAPVPALVHGGEAVLTPRAVESIGGPRVIHELNRGAAPEPTIVPQMPPVELRDVPSPTDYGVIATRSDVLRLYDAIRRAYLSRGGK